MLESEWGLWSWKILDQLNVWLFNVKQGFCWSKKLLLFGVVSNCLTFSKFEDFSVFFHYCYKIWSITRDICLHSHVWSVEDSFKKYDDHHEMRQKLWKLELKKHRDWKRICWFVVFKMWKTVTKMQLDQGKLCNCGNYLRLDTPPTVFSQFQLQPTLFFKQISQVKNLVINTGGLIFPKRVTKVSKVF